MRWISTFVSQTNPWPPVQQSPAAVQVKRRPVSAYQGRTGSFIEGILLRPVYCVDGQWREMVIMGGHVQLLIDSVILGWVGANRPEGMFIAIGRLATLYYFVHFLIILPILGKMERPRPLPVSISSSVLGGARPVGAHAASEKA